MFRSFCLAAAALALLAAAPLSAEQRHGLSAFGDLKYPQNFPHFDYVNPDAPKGGRITTIGTAGVVTFDSLNGYILKGDAAQKLDLLFDTLMVRAFDEPDAVYGLVARTADLADDKMSVTFTLRPEAKFADGTPLTAEDVAFSFDLIKKDGHPRLVVAIRDVVSGKAVDRHTVRYTFKGENVRDLPMIVAALPILSKAYYTANDFAKTTLEPPLGSGPYRVKDLKQGQHITYELRGDYWAKDLPVNRGRFNFGEIKLLYFRDRTAELEALKAGLLDLREEFTSKSWMTEYNVSALEEGRLIKAVTPDARPSGAQGFFLNMRRKKFADARVRQAMDLAFDYEWTNKNLFFNLYIRTQSPFENSAFKSKGTANDAEKALLIPLRDHVPAGAYEEPYKPPVSDGSGQDRKLLRKASQLLREAGWTRQGNVLKNADGETLTIEFLIFAPTFERVIAPYVRNLKLLGVDASIRFVEAAQYQERLKTFDFDIITQRFAMGQTPGVELQAFFSSTTAEVQGSFNLAGVKNPAVDALIGHAIRAKSREELNTALRALDRVLRGLHFWVPHWYKASHNVAHWDMFGAPETKPAFDRGILETWWIDSEKLSKLEKGP